MPHLFIRSTVKDFDVFRLVYDEHSATRSSFGLSEVALHRGVDDANELTLIFDLESIARAREFVESDDTKEAMMRAGVQGMPEIWFTD